LVWKLYEHSPEVVVRAGNLARRVYEAAGTLHYPVFEFRGPRAALGGGGCVLAAGPKAQAEFFAKTFLARVDSCREVDSVLLRRLDAAMVNADADIRFAFLDRALARRYAPGARALVPEWIGTEVAVTEARRPAFRLSHGLRHSLRQAEACGLSVEITRGLKGYEDFLEHAHIPSMRHRFGSTAVIENAYQIRRWLRRGGFVRVKQEGACLLAAVYRIDAHILRAGAHGRFAACDRVNGRGAGALLYRALFDLAASLNVSRVDLGGVRPFANDGVLQFKRRWGAELTGPTTANVYALYSDGMTTALTGWARLRRPIVWQRSGLGELQV